MSICLHFDVLHHKNLNWLFKKNPSNDISLPLSDNSKIFEHANAFHFETV